MYIFFVVVVREEISTTRFAMSMKDLKLTVKAQASYARSGADTKGHSLYNYTEFESFFFRI
jgi:hypothetical protein